MLYYLYKSLLRFSKKLVKKIKGGTQFMKKTVIVFTCCCTCTFTAGSMWRNE